MEGIQGMKPIKPNDKGAFGPYAGKQELDMTGWAKRVYNAITSETGRRATIFDAIMFALYGTGKLWIESEGTCARIHADKIQGTLLELVLRCGKGIYHPAKSGANAAQE